MPEYFLVLVALFICTIFLQKAFKVKIYKSLSHLLVFNGICLVVATIWDQFAIYRGHWSFNDAYLLGPKLGFMPIEEFFFVFAVGYFGLVMYKLLEKRF